MPLPIFDLPNIIQHYNSREKKGKVYFQKSYHLQETFGWSDFIFLKEHQELIQTMNDPSDHYHYSKEEMEYNRHRMIPWAKSIHERLQASQPRKMAETPVVEKNPTIEERMTNKRHFQEWQTVFYQTLAALDWTSVKSKVKGFQQRRLKDIKKAWDNVSAFSFCTNEALVMVADTLPMLIEKHQQLKSDFNKKSKQLRHIPPDIKDAYAHYLTDFITEAEKLQLQLAASMLAKLQVWDATQFLTTSPFWHLHLQLKAIGISTLPPPLTSDPYDFTSEQFIRFHHTIEKFGSKAMKRQLKQLSWFQQEGALPVRSLQTEEGLFFVPASIAAYVPLKKPFLPWLFRGEALRYDYFKFKTLPLASLRKIIGSISPESGVASFSQAEEYLSILNHQHQIICDLIQELENPPYSDLSVIFFSTRNCFKQWLSELKIYQQTLLAQKIQMAENLVQSTVRDCERWRQDRFGLNITGVPVDWNVCTQIELLLTDLALHCTSTEVDKVISKRVDALQKTFDTVRTENRCFDILQQLSQGNLITGGEKKVLFEFYSQERLRSEAVAKAFLDYCHPRLEKVVEHFECLLKQRPQKEDTLAQIENLVTQLIDYDDIILQLGDANQKKRANELIKKKIPYFFLDYLERLILIQQYPELRQQLSAVLAAMEKCLQALGQDVWQGESSCAQHVEILQSFRHHDQWGDIEATVLPLIKGLHKKLLIKRMDKDCQALDTYLFTATERDIRVGYSPAELQQLKEMRDNQVSEVSPGQMMPSAKTRFLPAIPREPLDENHPAVKPRAQYFGFSVRAHQSLHQLQTSDHSTCLSTVRILSKQFETLFQSHPDAALKKENRKSMLFSKTYVDLEVEKIVMTKE